MSDHTYRWRRMLGGHDRHGHPCRVLALLAENERLRDLLGRVLSSLEMHIPHAPWHLGQALDDKGNLIVAEGSLVAEARAALEPRA